MNVGFGYDIHRLKKGKNLILGGVKIENDKGLEGHSDADVVLHAIMDALLGASCLGDIGQYFPENDSKFKGISSMYLTERIMDLIDWQKYKINNVDLTIILERPKLYPYYPNMKKNIAQVLNINEGCINIKATTNEGLGVIGKEEAIAVFCVISLEKNFLK